MMLTASQLETIDRDGYVTVDTPFTAEQIAAGAAAMDRLCDDKPGGIFSGDVTDPALYEPMLHPCIVEAAKQMLRAERVVLRATVMRRTTPTGGATEVGLEGEHCDIRFPLSDWEATPRRTLCTILIWFSDVTPTRAPYMWRPGSLRQLAAEYTGEHRVFSFQYADLPKRGDADPQPLTAKAGQISVGNNGVIHSGSHNLDSEPRRVMFTQWQSPETPYVDLLESTETWMQQIFDELSPRVTPEQRELLGMPRHV